MSARAFQFVTRPEVQRLSAQAEAFLNRLLEAFPKILIENGRAPADCTRLRDACYAHRTDVLDSHIGRWLKELEQHSVVILWQTSDRSRWLCLARKTAQSHSIRPAISHPSNVQSIEPSLLNPDGNGVIPVIHNSAGLSPPNQDEIAVVAAAATNSLDLITRLREFFPRHDVASEFERYFTYRKKLGRPAIASAFVKWMLRAEIPLKKPSSVCPGTKTPSGVGRDSLSTEETISQPDLFDDLERKRFLKQYAERKARAAVVKECSVLISENEIKESPPAWLTDRHKRACVEIGQRANVISENENRKGVK